LQIPISLHQILDLEVSDYIVEGAWSLPEYIVNKDRDLTTRIFKITLPIDDIADRLHWNVVMDGVLTNKLSYSFLAGKGQRVNWFKLIWNNCNTPNFKY